jgi:hypothetical protein
MLNSRVRLHRIPGPSALLYYQNTEMRSFVATKSGKVELIWGKKKKFLDKEWEMGGRTG